MTRRREAWRAGELEAGKRGRATGRRGVGGELHDAADGGLEGGVAAVGEVGSADGAHDDEVAADEDAFGGEVVHDVAGGVAGGEDDVDGEGAEHEALAVLDVSVGGAGG